MSLLTGEKQKSITVGNILRNQKSDVLYDKWHLAMVE